MPFTASSKRADQKSWIFFAVFYAICTNIPFWYARHAMGFYHNGWFCVEYAFVGLFALYAPRWIAAILLFAVISADMVCAISETYFLSPGECLTNLTSLGEVSGKRLLSLSLVILSTALVVAIAAFFPISKIRSNFRGRTALCLLVFIGICVIFDGVTVVRRNGSIPNPFRPKPPDTRTIGYYTELRLSRRTLVRLVTLESDDLNFGRPKRLAHSAVTPLPGASAQAMQLAATSGTQHKPNVVLVLLESWGLSNDEAIRNALVQPYAQPELLARYQVTPGTVVFSGPTMGGEGRELCDSNIGFQLLAASSKSLQGCLPDQLAARGYHNIAVHGLDGHMFERSDWWKRIGFNETLFRDQFQQQGLPECFGAFTGICDADIAEWIGNRLAAPSAQPDFIYWMTLNSHLPVPIPSPLKNGASCSLSDGLTKDAALCSWYQLVANVHRSVARTAMTDLSRPTIFIIVGDHAPPFADPETRSGFSSRLVPFIILMPRPDPRVVAVAQRGAQ